MAETVKGNEGNGTEQPRGNGADKQGRRAQSSTERSRKHRARKAEEGAREAALQAEREREAAEKAVECEAGATVERVAETVASTESTVVGAAPESTDVAADPPAVGFYGNGVPATKVEWFAWRILAPAEHPARRDWITILIALAMATVSASFSITGMTAIFVGAFGPVIALGVVLELGKLRAVALLGMGRGSRRLRAALIAMVAILMTLNAVGAYGFLAKAHIGHQVEGDVAVTARLADIEGRIAMQSATLADIDRRLGQIDGAIEKAMAQGRTNSAMQLANDQRHTRTALQVDRLAAGKTLAELKVERARIGGERRTVEADLGPVRYLAALLGADTESALRVFILVAAMLLDPLAVLLLLASSTRTTSQSRNSPSPA